MVQAQKLNFSTANAFCRLAGLGQPLRGTSTFSLPSGEGTTLSCG